MGLEIIGVSLDKKVEEWTKAMKEEKMEWLNMIDMESRIARLYFVRGIPHTILLDENNEWYCPNCGNRNHKTLNVCRRTCGYLGDNFWNKGRTQEIKERFVHLDNRVYQENN